jgi:hypothetical protein
MFIKALSASEVMDLEDIYMTEYKDKPIPPGGFAELWFQCVVHFIGWCEDDIIPQSLVAREQELIEKGLSQDYFEALLDQVDMPEGLTPADQFVLLMGATSGERREALKRVLENEY